jgi:hypothetical protein
MSKGSHDDRIIQLERDNADLRRRVNLLELFLSSERRERSGITADEIRSSWARDAGIAQPTVQEYGPL